MIINEPQYDESKNITGITGLVIPIMGISNVMSNYLNDISSLFRKGEHYYIVIHEKAVRLTARQAACLTYLATGKTMKQLANTFECCPRTVEYHVEVLKQKLNAYVMIDLVNCFWRNPIKWF